MRLVVLGRELLLDALLELPEDVLERNLSLRRRGDLGRPGSGDLVAELFLQLFGEVEEALLVGEETVLVDGRLGRSGRRGRGGLSSLLKGAPATETYDSVEHMVG